MKKEGAYVERSKDHARKKFISQGTVSEVATSLQTSFIVPFAREITKNTAYIGFLSAFSGLLAPLGNLWGSNLMERYSRKQIHMIYTLFQALVWVPIMAIPFLYWGSIATTYLPLILLVFYSIFVLLTGVKDPSSFSWLGDLVSEHERGKYFAQRNKIMGIYGLIVVLVAGFALKYLESQGVFLASLTALFVISVVLRIISYYQVKHIFCPHFKLNDGYYFSFWSFIRSRDNFTRFAIFQAVFNFAIMFASPFFAVYMLQDLGFDIFTFTVVSASTTAFYLLFTPLAGKFSDKYGNVRLLYIAGFMFPLTPILWLFLNDPLSLILIPGLISGIANAAFTIGVTNFTYDSVQPQKRGLCVAYTSILNGVGVFLGSIAGGLMIQYLHINFMNSTLFVFIIAAVLRFIVAVIYLPRIKEVKKTDRLRGLSWDVLHPFKTIHSDVVWFKDFVRET